MKYLKPMVLKPSYYRSIEATIQMIFDKEIFGPLFKAISGPVQNSKDPLSDAIASGSVWYSDGVFRGKFSAKISKRLRGMGAKYDARIDGWRLDISKAEAEILAAQAQADNRAKDMRARLESFLANTNPDSFDTDTFRVEYEHTIDKMETDYRETAKGITIPPNMTAAQRATIAESWGQNLDLYVRKWASENILKMRQEVQKHVLAGGRAEALAKVIQQNYNESKNKSKFLARQETALLMSKFQETRYAQAGITKYKWSGADDARERKDHKRLNGRIFSFDDPPVTNLKTGARNNPGQDFNCFPGRSKIQVFDRIEKVFRRWYAGKLTEIVLESGETIRATPNHPMLTQSGWKPISILNNSDYILKISEQLHWPIKPNANNGVTTFFEIFASFRKTHFCKSFAGQAKDFHGDGSAYNINVIDAARHLSINGDSAFNKRISKFLLAAANNFNASLGSFFEHLSTLFFWYSLSPLMRGFGKLAAFLKSQTAHANFISFRAAAYSNIPLQKSIPDDISTDAQSLGNGKLTFSANISSNNSVNIDIDHVVGGAFVRIRERRNTFYIGHVFNLQTKSGYYATEGVIVSNCRCIAIPVIG